MFLITGIGQFKRVGGKLPSRTYTVPFYKIKKNFACRGIYFKKNTWPYYTG